MNFWHEGSERIVGGRGGRQADCAQGKLGPFAAWPSDARFEERTSYMHLEGTLRVLLLMQKLDFQVLKIFLNLALDLIKLDGFLHQQVEMSLLCHTKKFKIRKSADAGERSLGTCGNADVWKEAGRCAREEHTTFLSTKEITFRGWMR